jgi:hypothetical protein
MTKHKDAPIYLDLVWETSKPTVPGSGVTEPDINTGKKWTDMDIEDLEIGIREAWPVSKVAHYLRRTEKDVQDQTLELFGRELPTVVGSRKRPKPQPFDRDDLARLIRRRGCRGRPL